MNHNSLWLTKLAHPLALLAAIISLAVVAGALAAKPAKAAPPTGMTMPTLVSTTPRTSGLQGFVAHHGQQAAPLSDGQLRSALAAELTQIARTAKTKHDRNIANTLLRKIRGNHPNTRFWIAGWAAIVAAFVSRILYVMFAICVRGRICNFTVLKWFAGAVVTGVERAAWMASRNVDCWRSASKVRCVLKGRR